MKRVVNIIYLLITFIMLLLPLCYINLKTNQISVSENRNLVEFPKIDNITKALSKDFLSEFNSWFNDHIGFREQLIFIKGRIDFKLFGKINVNDMYLGKDNELLYFTSDMLKSYQHKNLLTDEELNQLVGNFSYINDYFNSKGIMFLYMPCYDKHSILPEQVPSSINQYGDMSLIDQIVQALNKTNVNVVDFKDKLIELGTDSYGTWSDPTHWTEEGAHIAYLELINVINSKYDVKVLSDDDYSVDYRLVGTNLFNRYYQLNYQKKYNIKEPRSVKISNALLEPYASDERHTVYYNSKVNNDLKVLIVGDSYINDFLLDDLAETFNYTYMIWQEYLYKDIVPVIENINPDIVIFEFAERVFKDYQIFNVANKIKLHSNNY